MSIRESIQNYREQSPIHGVGFISVSKTTGGSFFWTVVVIIASCFAIVDFKNLIDFYQTEPTVVKVEVLKTSDIGLPVPTLCMEIAGINPEIKPDWGDRYWWPRNRTVDVNDTIQKALVLVSKIKEIVDAENDTQFLSALEFLKDEHNTDLVSYTYMMMSFLSSFEALLSKLTYTTDQFYFMEILFRYFFFWQLNMNQYVETDRPLIEKLFRTYQSNNISLRMITQIIGSHMCKHLYLNNSIAVMYNSPKSFLLTETETSQYLIEVPAEMSLCSPKHITYVSFPMVCTKVAGANSTTGSPIDFEIFNFQPISTWHFDFQGRILFPGNDDPNVHSFIPRWIYDYSNDRWSTVHTNTFVSAHVSGYQKFQNKKRKPCLSSSNKFDGMLEQRIQYIHDICGCWPITGFNSNPTVCSNTMKSVTPEPNGSASGYDTPLNAIRLAVEHAYVFYNDSCALKAATIKIPNILENCEAIQFQSSETIALVDKTETSGQCEFSQYCHTNSSSSYRVKIYAGSFIALSESSEKNWSTFVSEFGGSIGVWLGASLIAFLHIPVYIFNVLYDYYKFKKDARLNVNPVALYSDDNISQSANELWQSTLSGESFALGLQRPGIHM